MIESIAFDLQVSEADKKELLAAYQQMVFALENGQRLRPKLAEKLKCVMWDVLQKQESFSNMIEKVDAGQHLQLHLKHGDNQILNLPWRLSLDQYPFLFVSKGITTKQKSQFRVLPLPLKILVMIAAPENRGARLSYEEEEEQIIRSFEPLYAKGEVQIDFTVDGSLESLRQKLRENHYHVVHFSGHGKYSSKGAVLLLEEEFSIDAVEISAQAFAKVFNEKPEHRPALVILSSCQTAQGNASEEFSGVVNHLLKVGIPGVVAMGISVLDYFATTFAGKLYQELAEKEPLHRAFKKAVDHIRQREREIQPQEIPGQWMIPQLYQTNPDLTIIDWEAAYEPLQFRDLKLVFGKSKLLLKHEEGYQFLGRRRERKKALSKLIQNQAFLIKGQGGLGKTSFAEHLVQRLMLRPGKRKAFFFGETTESIEAILEAMIDYLRKEEKQYLIRSEMEKASEKNFERFLFLLGKVEEYCQPIFVFDNLESFQVEPGGSFDERYGPIKEIIGFLYEMQKFPLILTGRYSLADFPEIEVIDLNQVKFPDFYRKAQQLELTKMIAEVVPTSQARQPRKILQQLHESIGGNYRMLEFFHTLLQKDPNKAFSTLAELQTAIASAKEESLHQMSEDLIFEQLWDLVPEKRKSYLQVLINYNRPVLPLAIELQLEDTTYLESTLEEIVDLTLLERHEITYGNSSTLNYYYLPPLVKELLSRVIDREPSFSHKRAGDYYYYIDQTINNRTYEDLEEAFHHYLETTEYLRIEEIVAQLSGHYYNRSNFRLSYYFASRVKENTGTATFASVRNSLGVLLHKFGELDQALSCLEQALHIQQEIGDRSSAGTTLNNISQVYEIQGNYERALDYLEQSLSIHQEIGDRYGEARTLNNISQIYHARGDYEKALEHLEQSLQTQQEIRDRYGEGVTLNNISQIYYAQGDHERALEYLEQSLHTRKEIGDRSGESGTLNNIGQIYDSRGEYERALEYYEQSLHISQELGERLLKAAILNNIGGIYQNWRKHKRALEYYEQSLRIQQEIGDQYGEGRTLNNIGQIYQDMGNYERALDYSEQSLCIRQEIGDRSGEGKALHNIGLIYQALGNYEQASCFLDQSLCIQQEIEERYEEGRTLHNIGWLYYVWGDYEWALEHLDQSLRIQQEIGDRYGEGRTLNNIGQIYKTQEDYNHALECYEQSLLIHKELGDLFAEGRNLNNIGEIYDAQGNHEVALDYFYRSMHIQKKDGDRFGLTVTMHNMAMIFLKEMENIEKYIEYESQAFQISVKINSTKGIFNVGGQWGIILVQTGQIEEGKRVLELAINAGEQADFPEVAQLEHFLQQINTQ